MTTTILAPAAAVFTLTGLPADVFGSCSLQPPAPAPAPPAEDTIYTPVAPGISYEALPEIVVVDTSPDQMVGCIFDTADNAQSRLNALFPDAIAGDGVIERRNNDIWVFDGTVWNNVGPTPGPTIQNVTSIVLPYNETAIYDAQIRLGNVVSKFDYALELLTEVEPLVVTLGLTAARVKLLTSEASAVTLSGQAAGLLRRYRMVSSAGGFALNGFGAGSVRDYVIGTNAGTFTATGQEAALVYERLPLIAEGGVFMLGGENAALFKGIAFGASAGSFNLIGQDAGSVRHYVLAGNAGALSLQGQASAPKPAQLIDARINSASDADTTAVVTTPTHSAGDLLVAVFMWRSDKGTLTVPSGWTLRGTFTSSILLSGGVQQNLLVYTKAASSSEPSSYTWTASVSTRNAWLSASLRNASLSSVSEAYGNGTTATINTVANRLNLTVFTWLYAPSGTTVETYSQSAADSSLAQITDSPKLQARLSGGYTTSATTVTSTHGADTIADDPNHGGINLQFGVG